MAAGRATQKDTCFDTYIAGEALPEGRCVKISAAGSGKNPPTVVLADAADDTIGVTTTEAFATGDRVTVALTNKPGTIVATAAGAFVPGAELFGAADGKVDDSGTVRRGFARGTSGADGDAVEIIMQPAPAAA